MIALKFPQLEKLLEKNTGELDDDDPKKGICIKDGHAIIVMEQAMLFFDLADYFTKTNKFTDNNVIKEMEKVLEFMEGKMFSGMFWKELTNLNQINVSPEGLNLDGVIRKDIYYREKTFDETEIRMLCHSIAASEGFDKIINAIYVEPLFKIISALKLKTDTIVFKTVGQNTQIYFTLDENPWIYGVISTNSAVDTKNFIFDSLHIFAEDISK